MEITVMGNSGLKVSRLCFGTMTFGGSGVYSEIGKTQVKDAKALIDVSIDSGINFFDTADVYSNGLSEKILGEALGSKRKDVIIATKVCHNAGGTRPNDQGLSRNHIIDSIDSSLRRLKTDYIDIYLAHEDDSDPSLEVTLRTFDDLVRQGKVRYIGCSNYAAWVLLKTLHISEKYNLEKYINFQGFYNIGSRELENEHIPLCIDQGLGITTYSPLGGEFFTGRFRKNKPYPKDTRRTEELLKFFPLNEEKSLSDIKKLLCTLFVGSYPCNPFMALTGEKKLGKKVPPGFNAKIISPNRLSANLIW